MQSLCLPYVLLAGLAVAFGTCVLIPLRALAAKQVRAAPGRVESCGRRDSTSRVEGPFDGQRPYRFLARRYHRQAWNTLGLVVRRRMGGVRCMCAAICCALAAATSLAIILNTQKKARDLGPFRSLGQVGPADSATKDLLHAEPHNGSYHFSSELGIARVVSFRPPNTRRKAFLAIESVAGHLESRRSHDEVNSFVEDLLASDFARGTSEETSLRWAIEKMNAVSTSRQHLKSGCIPQKPTEDFANPAAAAPATAHTGATSLSRALRRSAVLRQIILRYQLLVGRDQSAGGTTAAKVAYIRRYSALWLIANDIIVGSTVAAWLTENTFVIADGVGTVLGRYVIAGARSALASLQENPGGLKLNSDLGAFFCDAFLWFLSLWDEVFLASLMRYLPMVIRCVALSAYLGSTFALSAASDLVALSSLHLFVFHFMTASIYRAHVNMLYSLFNIFRGKKYNPVRQRIEPCSYELDQLLIGTILFTLAVFLFPTVLVYHIVCAVFRFASIVVQAGLELALTFVNHFPLFAVMLRIKEPGRLPGGMRLKLLAAAEDDVPRYSLSNRPISLGRIFSDQRRYLSQVLRHYATLPQRILTGQILLPFAAEM